MNTPRKRIIPASEGFSIVEVIVVMAIIGILTLILVPVVSSRAKTARIRAAEQDLENLANGMERAGIETGYYFRPNVLDDVPFAGDNIDNTYINPINPAPIDRVDAIDDEDQTNPAGVNFFIDVNTQNLLSGAAASNLYAQITARSPDTESQFGWSGPYVTWHRDGNYNDWPDDPWGHDYIFFTRIGAMSANETAFVLSNIQLGPPTGPFQALPANTLMFDRPTFLSLGPDGLPGDGTANPTGNGEYGAGDDLIRKF